MRVTEPGGARIEGIRPTLEALRAARRRVFEVGIPQRLATEGLRELDALCRERRVRRVPVEVAAEVYARAEPFPEEAFEALLATLLPRLLVVLDRVTDTGNLGAIARTALAAGFGGLVLPYRHSAAITPGALRASAGALEHLRVGRTPNLGKALELARREGVDVWIAEPGGMPFETIPALCFARDLAWVFGSEDRGVRASVRSVATGIVGIPLEGRIASLGVAAAASYLLTRTAEARRACSPVATG